MTSITDTSDLWAAYKKSASQDVHNQLVVRYSSLVEFVAGRVATGLPSTVEHGDLVSYGMFGLIDSIEKLEPD